jgi:hypothetical protein
VAHVSQITSWEISGLPRASSQNLILAEAGFVSAGNGFVEGRVWAHHSVR